MKKILLPLLMLLFLQVQSQPPINTQVTSITACQSESTVFALDEKVPEILGNIPPESVIISFHLVELHAFFNLNPIPATYEANESTVIFVRAEDVNDPGSFAITSFDIILESGPNIQPQEFITCNGAFFPENTIELPAVAQQIWASGGLTANDASLTFYASLEDAGQNLNPLPPVIQLAEPAQTIYVVATSYLSGCSTIVPIYLYLEDCGGGGLPVHLFACTDSSEACFDMTVNFHNVLANLDPETHVITFHLSQADAESYVNAIADIQNFCVPVSVENTQIFIRLTDLQTGEYSISSFSLVGQQYELANIQLPPLFGCDDDADGITEFNLTFFSENIQTSNPLEFYSSSPDAAAGVNPILNPQSYPMAIENQEAAIFIREIVDGDCDIIYSGLITALPNCNFVNSCLGANALCSSMGVPFDNTFGVASQGPVACLGSTPNPTWFVIPISESGSLNVEITQGTTPASDNLDVDYICYGPFSDPQAACSSMLTPDNVVACSYSHSAVEYLNIGNAEAGKYYLLMITNFADEPGFITINLLGGSAGVDCTAMEFNAFLDQNSNGVKDPGEANFTLGDFVYEKNNSGIVHNYSTPDGHFSIYDTDATNTYDVSFEIDSQYAGHYSLSTSFEDLSITLGATNQYYFPITVENSYQDLSVSIIPIDQPNPGFNYSVQILYANNGNVSVPSATIEFMKDPLTNFIAASEPGIVLTPEGFTFSASNLLPFETRSITVTLQVPVIPNVQLGDLLTTLATISPVDSDILPQNNEAACSQTVVGSYDPNDKMESHGRFIDIDDFGDDDYLFYTIRFENTGTAPAQTVRINDVLDSSLDASSVRMIAASHDYTMDRVENEINWNFSQIMLPPASSDPEGAKGYVYFKVKPMPGYSAGTVIPNHASIFFDFNPPIITNTFTTEFVELLAVGEVSADAFVIYPNPASAYLTIASAGKQVSSVTIYDVTGKKIYEAQPGRENPMIDVSSISSGFYLLEIRDNSGRRTTKRIAIQ